MPNQATAPKALHVPGPLFGGEVTIERTALPAGFRSRPAREEFASLSRLVTRAQAEPIRIPGLLRRLSTVVSPETCHAIGEHLERRRGAGSASWNARALTIARACVESLTGRPYRVGRPCLKTDPSDVAVRMLARDATPMDQAYERARIASALFIRRRALGMKAPPRAPKVAPLPMRGPTPKIDWGKTGLRFESEAHVKAALRELRKPRRHWVEDEADGCLPDEMSPRFKAKFVAEKTARAEAEEKKRTAEVAKGMRSPNELPAPKAPRGTLSVSWRRFCFTVAGQHPEAVLPVVSGEEGAGRVAVLSAANSPSARRSL